MISTTFKFLLSYVLLRIRYPATLLSKLSWHQISKATLPTQSIPTQKTFLDIIPSNSWDSHMHVVDPIKYPLAVDAQYTPKPHPLSEALKFESSLRINNIVLVQPSIYGTDNTCMLDALRQLGSHRARAVVAFDPNTTSIRTLQEWHAIGVRGVRINLQSVGRSMDSDELAAILNQYADMIRPFDWVLQLYVPLHTTVALEKIVPKLRVRVCLDHFGQPSLPKPGEKSSASTARSPYLIPGFTSLINLLAQGNTYIKMSAPYRISEEPEYGDLASVAKELLRVAGRTRVLFATDWPHTRFEGLDIRLFTEKVMEWCGEDELLINRVFRSNAEDLWGVAR